MKPAKAGPESAQPFSADLVDAAKFWAKVKRGDGCWEWGGHRQQHGYGTMGVPLFRAGPVMAHRIAYALTHGFVPARLSVMHACDNPGCVRPDHLRLGTHQENMRDALDKGRIKSGPQQTHCERAGHLLPQYKGVGVHRHCTGCARDRQRANAAKMWAARHAADLETIAPYVPPTLDLLVRCGAVRDAHVLTRYFGLYGHVPETLEAIGGDYNVSRERIRQIVNRALTSLGADELVGTDRDTDEERMVA